VLEGHASRGPSVVCEHGGKIFRGDAILLDAFLEGGSTVGLEFDRLLSSREQTHLCRLDAALEY
jgi:hypothetical protein